MRTRANDLQQTLILMTPLILTALAVAFAFRLRALQHRRPGPVLGRVLRRARYSGRTSRDVASAAHPPRARRLDRRGRALGRHRGLPEGDRGRARGDHDDHAELDRHLRRRVPRRDRPPAAGPGASIPRWTACSSRRAVADLGQPPSLHPGLLSRSSPCRLPRLSNRTTLGVEVGRSALALRRLATPVSPSPRTTSLRSRSGPFACLAGSVDLRGLKSPSRRRLFDE